VLRWARDVWINVVANLIAAALVYLGGVFAGLFPANPVAVFLASSLSGGVLLAVLYFRADYLVGRGRAGCLARLVWVASLPVVSLALGLMILVGAHDWGARSIGIGVIIIGGFVLQTQVGIARERARLVADRRERRRRSGTLAPPPGLHGPIREPQESLGVGVGRRMVASPGTRRRVSRLTRGTAGSERPAPVRR
jgi:hypothetical protein